MQENLQRLKNSEEQAGGSSRWAISWLGSSLICWWASLLLLPDRTWFRFICAGQLLQWLPVWESVLHLVFFVITLSRNFPTCNYQSRVSYLAPSIFQLGALLLFESDSCFFFCFAMFMDDQVVLIIASRTLQEYDQKNSLLLPLKSPTQCCSFINSERPSCQNNGERHWGFSTLDDTDTLCGHPVTITLSTAVCWCVFVIESNICKISKSIQLEFCFKQCEVRLNVTSTDM